METETGRKNESEIRFSSGGLSHARAAAYGLGSVGTVIFIVTPQILLLYFLTRILGAPPVWAGVAILAPKAVELALDPLVGALSDRTRSRHGRRWPYLASGALAFPLIFAALFAPPAFAAWPLMLTWVAVSYVASTIAYTFFAVPYITLVGEMSTNPATRMQVVAWRMAFVAVGVLIAGAGAPAIVSQFQSPRTGYAVAGACLAVLCLICAACAALAARPLRRPDAERATGPVLGALSGIFRAKRYRALWTSYALQMTGVSANAALLPFAVEYQLRADEGFVGAIFASMTLATLAAMPIAVLAGRRLGQVSGYIASVVLSAAGLVAFLWAGAGAALPALLAATVFGIGQAGGTSFPFALMPGAAEDYDDRAARLNAGAFAGVWTAGEKLGLAAGGAVAAALLAAIGFQEGQAAQSGLTTALIPWIFSVAPALLMLAALLPAFPLLKTALNRRYAA